MEQIKYLGDDELRLVQEAKKAQANARAISSGYKVGAAIFTQSGKIFTGCNVETTHYLTTHAERNALDSMVAAGEKDIKLLALVTKDAGPCCGQCRQDIWDFAQGDQNLPIIFSDGESTHFRSTIGELLPYPFPKPDTKII